MWPPGGQGLLSFIAVIDLCSIPSAWHFVDVPLTFEWMDEWMNGQVDKRPPQVPGQTHWKAQVVSMSGTGSLESACLRKKKEGFSVLLLLLLWVIQGNQSPIYLSLHSAPSLGCITWPAAEKAFILIWSCFLQPWKCKVVENRFPIFWT